ncbi:HAD family hydrolase [Mucilaginibacter lacusdianchii]|uniref:HAD family hydrolase n=1 Tax=Mucilaginibacter lacusdianchii TaxID=2684211 RepID=UPI00131E02C0|nr:HAD family hydrolase [Mucilaginibacter sp. JXJ CY 39]
MIKALILDLDNTIYPVESIGKELFKPLYDLMDEYKSEVGEDQLEKAKQELLKKAYQKVADAHNFPQELIERGVTMLRDLTYEGPMQPFADYAYLQQLKAEKFLVTMGFTKMQWRKVDLLDLRKDYKEVIVNDPDKTEATKKEVFQDILQKYGYQPQEVIAIGDDPDSEIKAAKDLGIATILYDHKGEFQIDQADFKIASFEELGSLPIELS